MYSERQKLFVTKVQNWYFVKETDEEDTHTDNRGPQKMEDSPNFLKFCQQTV